jgi:hypothetical protein
MKLHAGVRFLELLQVTTISVTPKQYFKRTKHNRCKNMHRTVIQDLGRGLQKFVYEFVCAENNIPSLFCFPTFAHALQLCASCSFNDSKMKIFKWME